jgi:hypothetical protein
MVIGKLVLSIRRSVDKTSLLHRQGGGGDPTFTLFLDSNAFGGQSESSISP